MRIGFGTALSFIDYRDRYMYWYTHWQPKAKSTPFESPCVMLMDTTHKHLPYKMRPSFPLCTILTYRSLYYVQLYGVCDKAGTHSEWPSTGRCTCLAIRTGIALHPSTAAVRACASSSSRAPPNVKGRYARARCVLGRRSCFERQTSELELERGAALFVGLREGALGVGIETVEFQTAEGMQAFGGQLCLQGMRVQMLSGRGV